MFKYQELLIDSYNHFSLKWFTRAQLNIVTDKNYSNENIKRSSFYYLDTMWRCLQFDNPLYRQKTLGPTIPPEFNSMDPRATWYRISFKGFLCVVFQSKVLRQEHEGIIAKLLLSGLNSEYISKSRSHYFSWSSSNNKGLNQKVEEDLY
jgi:hypothetical protein